MSKKYRVRLSPNGLQKSVVKVVSGVGFLYQAVTGVIDIRDNFREEERIHRRRRSKGIRKIFE